MAKKAKHSFYVILSLFVLLIIVLLYASVMNLNVNQKETFTTNQDSNQEICIVSMMKDPKNLESWLQHHRRMGVRRFYIRLEDTPKLEKFLSNSSDVHMEVGKSTGYNEYNDIQVRQRKWVNRAIELAKKDGMSWIIHIDSDELLNGDLDEIRKLPSSVRTFWMQNMEAKYSKIPRSEDNCFVASKMVDCSTESEKCVSYGNGKGGGRVADDVSEFGPHRFVSNQFGREEVKLKMVVYHYESCDFDIYKKKYKHLANQDEKTMKDIPFAYYKESIEAAKQSGDSALEQIFTKYRIQQ